MLEQVVSRLIFLDSEILIVTGEKRLLPFFDGHPKIRIVADTYPGKGPLGGIYTGLETSDSFYNLVVACDMPFLNSALLRYMIQLSANFDLVVPRWDGMVEPLHAVYSKNCLASIDSLLKRGILNIARLFGMVKVRYLETEDIDRFDPKHLSFFNINTEADLKRAKELVSEMKP